MVLLTSTLDKVVGETERRECKVIDPFEGSEISSDSVVDTFVGPGRYNVVSIEVEDDC